MIITRTPFRISFGGGGTDLAAFYRQEPGAVTSTAIDKYMYVTVNERFDDSIRLSYSRTEIVPNAGDVRHPIVRAALNLAGVTTGIEITSIADIPAGTGLGSSSTFAVGLLHALFAFKGLHRSREELARLACKTEIDILKEPIGKQDQYIAAFGGIRHIQFNPDESVFIDPVVCTKETLKKFKNNLMLFYTGATRSAGVILKKQRSNIKKEFETLCRMRDLARLMRDCLRSNADVDEVGALLDEGWRLKRSLAEGISNRRIDTLYRKARNAGAIGGKLLGAGGGGFLLLYVRKRKQKAVRAALSGLQEFHFDFEPRGSRIIFQE